LEDSNNSLKFEKSKTLQIVSKGATLGRSDIKHPENLFKYYIEMSILK
jgi:hypothetical protein